MARALVKKQAARRKNNMPMHITGAAGESVKRR